MILSLKGSGGNIILDIQMPEGDSTHQDNIPSETKAKSSILHDALPGAKEVLHLEFSPQSCVCRMQLKHCKEREGQAKTIITMKFQIK